MHPPQTCGNHPEIRSTEHLFLDLPGLKPELEAYVAAASASGGWSSNAQQTTAAWIRDGLKPRCITRDLKWGVPVPLEKFKDKVGRGRRRGRGRISPFPSLERGKISPFPSRAREREWESGRERARGVCRGMERDRDKVIAEMEVHCDSHCIIPV